MRMQGQPTALICTSTLLRVEGPRVRLARTAEPCQSSCPALPHWLQGWAGDVDYADMGTQAGVSYPSLSIFFVPMLNIQGSSQVLQQLETEPDSSCD